jgi:hypothetical protein
MRKMHFLKKNIENDGLIKFLGINPILDDASDPPGQRGNWAS